MVGFLLSFGQSDVGTKQLTRCCFFLSSILKQAWNSVLMSFQWYFSLLKTRPDASTYLQDLFILQDFATAAAWKRGPN